MHRTMTVWGAIVLCAPVVSCSRGGSSGAVSVSRAEALVEGTSVGALRIDEATPADAETAFGVSAAEARAVGSRGVVEMRTPLFHLSFVPPADGQGPPRLYAARAPLREDVYEGKTSRGIGFLDSADAMREAYGPPDAEWIQMNGERLHYYQQGVIFTTQHPKLIPPAVYAKARAALGKEPSEEPAAHVVTAIMVVRPFMVTKAGTRLTAGQQVISRAPETDLLVSAF
jgi:hypothetical protein